MVNGDVPFVICVSADKRVRERVVRRLDGSAALLICADLDELRAMLLAPASGTASAPGNASGPPGLVQLGDLTLDVAGHTVLWRGEPLPLTRLEREMLFRLAGPPLTVWTYQRLFHSVWGGAYLGDSSILHSTVKRLRRKLSVVDGYLSIKTIRGVGYRLAVSHGVAA